MRRILFLMIGVLTLSSLQAQNYQLHSVYIYSFIKYVEWPSETSGNFVIGVYGDSPVIDHLMKMAAVKKAGDKKIDIKKVSGTVDLTGLEILFVPDSRSADFGTIIKQLTGTNTLIITESSGLGQGGSNINFVEKSGKLRFELNKSAMDRQNLKVSSELTKLAILI